MRHLWAAAVAAAAIALAGGAEAKVIHKDGMTAKEAEAWLGEQGFEVETEKSDSGGYFIHSKDQEGNVFTFILSNCEKERCIAGTFFVHYDSDAKLSVEAANTWNVNNKFVRAYVGQGAVPMFSYDFILGDGVSYDVLGDSLGLWLDATPDMDKAVSPEVADKPKVWTKPSTDP